MTQVLTLSEVIDRVKISRSTLYAMLERGEFPRPIKLGERKNGWTDRQVENWIKARESEAETGISEV